MAARIKLGELLVRAGVLDDFKLKAALAEQQRWGGRLGKILVDMNFVSEELIIRALSKQLGIPRATFQHADSIPNEVLARIPHTLCTNNGLCPERYLPDKKTLVLAMADPTNVGAVDELRFKTGLRLETSLAGELEIAKSIERLFFGRAPQDGLELGGGGTNISPSEQYRAAMAASGVSTDDVEPQRGTPPPEIAPRTPARPMDMGFPSEPSRRPELGALPRPAPPPLPPPGMTASRTPSTAALEMAVAIEAAQKRQNKALRVMLELLLEKGVFSRDEYLQLVNRR